MTVEEIVKENPQGLIARAYRLAKEAHAGQKRESGEPYFEHVLETAEILNQWHLDEPTIAAGLLHDVVEDTKISIEYIRQEFGEEIAFLVNGLTKLKEKVKYRQTSEARVENLRKMIIALSEDLRVVFIKLADRLHNMRTLSALPPAKQKRIAQETSEIYAPLAYRLGMQNLSGELQDLAFPYLYPAESRWLKENMKEKYEERMAYLKKIKPEVDLLLKKHAISPVAIDFRAKRYSSLYQKLLRHNMDIERIYDLVAMRIIVDTVSQCYAVLGAIHEKWPPLPGRIKDYIAMPKPNGYRSLHTTVIGPENKIIEFQIRTQQMHEENENGIAAHWIYEQKKNGGGGIDPAKLTKEIQWVQQLRNWQKKYFELGSSPDDFLKAMKIDFFRDRIFAITPAGEVIDLPVGSTPIDFAYQIHSEIGDSCVGAKVNGQIVPLDYELRSGDVVQILTQKGKKPAEDWLKFVKTSIAKEHIKSALKEKNRFLRQVPSKSEFTVVVQNRIGLIKDISTVIARSHINILSINTLNQPSSHFTTIKIQCGITDKSKIERLILKLKDLKEIKEINYKII